MDSYDRRYGGLCTDEASSEVLGRNTTAFRYGAGVPHLPLDLHVMMVLLALIAYFFIQEFEECCRIGINKYVMGQYSLH